jgi:hypothetical protein
VTLARAWEPGAENVEGGEIIEFAAALDAGDMPDVQAWLDDPAPWPASRRISGAPPQPGDVAHDEEGWQLRFFVAGPDDPDVPVHRLCNLNGGLRPGEVLTVKHPDGGESAWRVVGVS